MTKIYFGCNTESLQQMDFLFVALSHCGKQNRYMLQKKGQNVLKLRIIYKKKHKISKIKHKKCQKEQKVPGNAACLELFGIFSKTHTNILCHSDLVQQTKKMFVAMTQCDKQKKSLSQ